MCGLFGFAGGALCNSETLNHARAARDTLSHRGPDQAGEWFFGSVYLGHRRLSIIDTSDAGRQPMTAHGLSVTVNGEIYNFELLRQELGAAGYVFKSRSDSEVVLHGFHYWGVDGLVERLDGMYAAVIFDSGTGRVTAFRDRVGIKPLIYAFDGKSLVWGSELKAVRAFLGVGNLEEDPEAIIDFLAYRYIPAPKTFYRNIFKLQAASILEFDTASSRLKVRRYWELNTSSSDVGPDTAADRLLELIDSSVSEQLVSDVPLGLLLSGGIDSSVIAAFASRHKPDMQSFSIGFRQEERDETPYALAMAAKVGLNHQVHYLQNEEMESMIERVDAWFDEPFADVSAIPTFRVCSFAADNVKVVLSGDGGDELFGGYRWYEKYRKATHAACWMPLKTRHGIDFPSPLPYRRELRLASFTDPVWRYAHIRGSLSEGRLNAWKRALGVSMDYDPLWAYRQHFSPNLPPRRAAQVMDFHTFLPDDIMVKVDRVSMAVSLECRPPLLSKRLIEFSFKLPESFIYGCQRGGLKSGLKSAVKILLPEQVLRHKKQGFSAPDSGWRKQLTGPYGSLQEGIVHAYTGEAVPF